MKAHTTAWCLKGALTVTRFGCVIGKSDTMELSRDRRKYNKLVDRRKQGDNWIELSYIPRHHAWRESQRSWGWSPFGKPKWEDEELEFYIGEIQDWVDSEDWGNPNYCKSIVFLKERGIVLA